MTKGIFLAVVLACLAAGCKTQSSLTAGATGCGATEVDVIESRFSRQGTSTAWCAKCKGKIYQCVSNPQRSRVECKEVDAKDACS